MRDIAVSLVIFGSLPLILFRPWIGVLVFAWLSLISLFTLLQIRLYTQLLAARLDVARKAVLFQLCKRGNCYAERVTFALQSRIHYVQLGCRGFSLRLGHRL